MSPDDKPRVCDPAITCHVVPHTHWADGWPSKTEHRMTEWQDILSRLPVPPTSEQLDDNYGTARRFMVAVHCNRGESDAA